ncbi:hypothetical protein BO70DRAFT_90511 [Aspergillus heteromorphus CBS 117.55]|uniref:Uncharacterized protein n=1 Tax=Aspergillus heteromorphus CBS 117.55 TaxID=1448321 RepID=A0A317VRJ1_9EURO|nr:uncharacterized protein BO70DRAFT_90511 [Aspergillus heteromorphus CBS 117.55]PWY76179.1 hypothetical protein BO70DRAFT_90511 [Aspergillus heteromorphus CBS 117.55]
MAAATLLSLVPQCRQIPSLASASPIVRGHGTNTSPSRTPWEVHTAISSTQYSVLRDSTRHIMLPPCRRHHAPVLIHSGLCGLRSQTPGQVLSKAFFYVATIPSSPQPKGTLPSYDGFPGPRTMDLSPVRSTRPP